MKEISLKMQSTYSMIIYVLGTTGHKERRYGPLLKVKTYRNSEEKLKGWITQNMFYGTHKI